MLFFFLKNKIKLFQQQVLWPSGKGLGGSSLLNGMMYVRGNHRNYDDWAKLGAVGWNYSEVLPYFKKLEDNKDYENGKIPLNWTFLTQELKYSFICKVTLFQKIFLRTNFLKKLNFLRVLNVNEIKITILVILIMSILKRKIGPSLLKWSDLEFLFKND